MKKKIETKQNKTSEDTFKVRVNKWTDKLMNDYQNVKV